MCACVELANAVEDEDAAEASIRAHCVDAGLARFKIPKYFMFIPRLQDYANAMGKINRNEFRALAERDAVNVK